ncbi:glycoside hydrolase family 26 protein [Cryobacterium sp. M23]|uniref:glycoside hydrolase family 26 protein n=1 Tax=Cryobacterium sp. M23 TaxID=2048292 RepID=UPI000CE40BAB|nr:glycosyl hydrolase [Cryobacterium sp. M23]
MRAHRHIRSAVAVSVVLLTILAGSTGMAAAPSASAASSATTLSLSPNTGPAGSTLTASGRGFPRNTAVTVTMGTTRLAVQTRANGTFSADLTVPNTTTSILPVTATVGTVTASASFTVSFAPVSTAVDPAATTTLTQQAITTSAPISASRLRFGVATPGGALANSELDAVATLVNESPSIVMSYKDFNQALSIAELDSVRARGATSLITWEPWVWGGGLSQPAYSSTRITDGTYDTYLTQWGQALAAWGQPVMLRYGHEMNGNWYPWADSVNGNAPGDYAAAWRHVHDVVAAAGATNVSWVWSPNIPYTGSTPLAGLYPGAAYVDVVALDGYNWGTSAAWSTWQAPAALFDTGLAQLRALAPGKQIIIAETSSAEADGSKSKWNTALVAYLAKQPDVTGFVWFHFLKETDWRINSSTTSTSSLAKALAARSVN